MLVMPGWLRLEIRSKHLAKLSMGPHFGPGFEELPSAPWAHVSH